MASGGLSIAHNLLSDVAGLNLSRNQSSLQRLVGQLSTGLRINSAADDPSGLAIAESLQAQVNGFDQASQNVQNAQNASSVAESALQTTTDILQRIRSLSVEAASDISSTSDRSNLQQEVSQLLAEVNRISQNTNFNGQYLLNGSHAGFQQAVNSTATISSNSSLNTSSAISTNLVTGVTVGPPVVNGNFAANQIAANSTAPINTPVPTGWTAGGTGVNIANGNYNASGPPLAAGQQGLVLQVGGGSIQQTLNGLVVGNQYAVQFTGGAWAGGSSIQVSAGGTPILTTALSTLSFTNYTATFTASATSQVLKFTNTGGNDLTITNVTAQSNNPLGALDGTIEVQVVNTGASIAVQETYFDSASGLATVSAGLYAGNQTIAPFDNVNVALGSFGTADVGSTTFIKINQGSYSASNPAAPAFNFQDGSLEGQVIQLGIAATNTATLRIANINLIATSTSLAAEDAIGQIDDALQTLLGQRAALGAAIVRLSEDQSNDNIASVNLQASESNVRDLNVASTTTEYTKQQILVQVGTSVLSQSNSNAQSVLGLFR